MTDDRVSICQEWSQCSYKQCVLGVDSYKWPSKAIHSYSLLNTGIMTTMLNQMWIAYILWKNEKKKKSCELSKTELSLKCLYNILAQLPKKNTSLSSGSRTFKTPCLPIPFLCSQCIHIAWCCSHCEERIESEAFICLGEKWVKTINCILARICLWNGKCSPGFRFLHDPGKFNS